VRPEPGSSPVPPAVGPPEPSPAVGPAARVVAPTPTRAPVPDTDAVRKAEAEVRRLFAAENAKRGAADRRALAERLLRLAGNAPDPADRYVLLREARDLAAQAGAVALALEAAGRAARDFEVDGLAVRAEAIDRTERAATDPVTAQALAEAGLELADEAAREDQFAVAGRLAATAGRAARVSKVPALMARAARLIGEVREIEAAAAAVAPLAARFRADPTDAEAGRAVGRFRCLIRGDWAAGLPVLAEFGDDPLRGLARRDLARPEATEDRLALADGWWDLAARETGLAAARARHRAADWYRQALPGLTGSSKLRADRRIAEVSPPDPFGHLDLANGTRLEDFVRIKTESRIGTRDEYVGPVEVTVVARTAGNNIRLFGPNGAVVIFN
jgi:hypothetical protein